MIAVSSRQSVSGPIIPTVRLLLARWICVCISGPVLYIYVYVYILDCCSSMDMYLGAGHIYIRICIYIRLL